MQSESRALHSVWLCPEANIASKLKAIVEQLAERQRAPSFDPHITLLGEISAPWEMTLRACKTLFGVHGPIEARVQGMARSTTFFKALTIDLALPQSILDARAELATELGQTNAPDFQPHLSLAYGPLPLGYQDDLPDSFAGAIPGMTLCLDRLVVVRSANAIPIEDWTRLEELPLNARPRRP